jgi:hypothetical protein
MPWAEVLTAFPASVSIARQWSVFFDLPGNVLLMANCRMRPGGCEVRLLLAHGDCGRR